LVKNELTGEGIEFVCGMSSRLPGSSFVSLLPRLMAGDVAKK
jgi:hypothetical protein